MLLSPEKLRKTADDSLSRAQNPRQVILLHTGVVLLLSLLLTIVDFFLNQQIGATGGLSGLDNRSILITVQSFMRLMQLLLLPFWQIGYTYYTLRIARGNPGGIADLTEGFRRFFPVLRLKMLSAGIGLLLAMGCAYLSSFLFMLTPWSASVFQSMEGLVGGTLDEAALQEALAVISAEAMLPITVIFLLCLLVLGIPLFYRYRMAELWLMDHPESGALAALRNSRRMMRSRCMEVFRVDLGFWWYMLLEILVTAVCYGDLLMEGLGIDLPVNETVSYFFFLVLYLVLQLVLYVWKQNHVSVTYAHTYLNLVPQEQQ